jgi:glycosyltransferase involved in cell wall biosynthesis
MEIKYPVQINKQLVFIGPETHEPNRQGLQWFLDCVWPLILKEEPEVTVAIIGCWSDFTVNLWQQQYQGIRFTGFVDKLGSAIAGSILIVPLFQGSGVRMKILEACNNGIPFVSTTIGAEGLGFTDGVNCFTSDNIQEFATKILKLLRDNTLANLFIERSVKHIREEFSDEGFVETRMMCYRSLINA